MLLETINQWAGECPNRIAHCHRGQEITYSELKILSDALACWIYNKSMAIHSPIIVYGHKENEMLISFLGCVKAGHPYIPVDSSLPPERVRQIVELSGAQLFLTTQGIPEGLADLQIFVQEIKHNGFLANPLKFYVGEKPEANWQVQSDDVYYIIFTSGSTGIPKGVQITRNALESFLNWVNSSYRPQTMQEVFLNQAPFSFDLSVMDLYMALSTGGTLWSVDKEEIANPQQLFKSFQQSGMTFWVSTPSFAELCLIDRNFNENLLPKLKRFLFCGEVLSHDTATKLRERFSNSLVENLYGPTEGTVAITTVTITQDILEQYNPLPVGEVKPDAQVLICSSAELDKALELAENTDTLPCLQYPPNSLPEGERGEIVIAGPNVSVGYLNSLLTQSAFFTWRDASGVLWRAYRTGDAGMLIGRQLLFFGRLDYQVKLHGYRIELGDIEENLRHLEGVENAVVLPVEKRGKIDSLQAFLTMSYEVSDEFQTSQELKKDLRKSLPDYMIPRRFRFLRSFPMTPNGKVDRKALQGGTH